MIWQGGLKASFTTDSEGDLRSPKEFMNMQ